MAGGAYSNLKRLIEMRHHARHLRLLPQQTASSVHNGRRRSHLRGRGLDFAELRHYRPGDDIRSMDWHRTRRLGTPYVRIFTEERDRPIWLLVDQRSPLFFGSRFQMKSVAAAELAALFAWHMIDQGDRVGGLIIGDNHSAHSTPSRSPVALTAWLERLVAINQSLSVDKHNESAGTTLAQALEQLARQVGHDGLVILISDFHDWDAHCLALLQRLGRSNNVIACHISDELERNIDKVGAMVVTDGQHQLQVDSRDDAVAARYSNAYSQKLEALQANCYRAGVPLLTFDTASDVASQCLAGGGAANDG